MYLCNPAFLRISVTLYWWCNLENKFCLMFYCRGQMRDHFVEIMEQGHSNTDFIKIGPDRSTQPQIIKPES